MSLKTYLKSNRGEAARLARAIGVNHVYLRNVAYGLRNVSADVAVAIEKESNGAVTVEDLRSDFADLLRSAGYVRQLSKKAS